MNLANIGQYFHAGREPVVLTGTLSSGACPFICAMLTCGVFTEPNEPACPGVVAVSDVVFMQTR